MRERERGEAFLPTSGPRLEVSRAYLAGVAREIEEPIDEVFVFFEGRVLERPHVTRCPVDIQLNPFEELVVDELRDDNKRHVVSHGRRGPRVLRPRVRFTFRMRSLPGSALFPPVMRLYF